MLRFVCVLMMGTDVESAGKLDAARMFGGRWLRLAFPDAFRASAAKSLISLTIPPRTVRRNARKCLFFKDLDGWNCIPSAVLPPRNTSGMALAVLA